MVAQLPASPGERPASASASSAGLALRSRDPANFAEEGGVWCAVDGRIEGSEPPARSAGGTARAILEAYRQNGVGFLEGLRGSFALTLVDAERRVALLAVDRRGVKRLAYQLAADGTLIFASSIDALRGHPGGRFELSAQAIFDFLHLSVIPAPQSIFRDVSKLLAAEYLLLEDGRLSTGRYWEPPSEKQGRNVDELCAETVECLRGAVRRSIAGGGGDVTGAFLSGGLDSSTVLGLATEAFGPPVKAFTIGFDTELYDELDYASIAVRQFAASHHTCTVTPADAAALLPKIGAVYDEPFGNSSAVPTFICADLARQHGIALMLAGDGGDEIFAGNERYVQQQVFDIYGRLPAPLRVAIEGTFRVLPGSASLPVLRKAAGYVRRARTPMPDRMMTYSFLGGDRLNEVFEPDFLRVVDPDGPLEALRRTYRRHEAGPLLRRMLQYDMQVTLADNDLRKVTAMCELAGVEVRFPFLDEAVIDLGARLPADLLIRGYRLRDFYKRALRGILPEPILRKRKHGFGMPVRFWIAQDTALRTAAGDAFASLKSRGIVRPDFLDRLLSDRDAQAAGGFGQLGWYLAVLEGWLASRRLGL
jgi:asparagine synthase (glutamine-hydrolysing)